jgi:hypothetical protein
MKLTDDERVVLIEALREYTMRMRIEDARRILSEALEYRLRKDLYNNGT